MTADTLRIATRKSPLALWQAERVACLLRAAHPTLAVELVPFVTQGDKLLDSPLAKIGGKGLFVKELEVAMQEARADIAVHSMKDVPVVLPEGFHIACILEREDPRDALVSPSHASLAALPEGARVGTSSLRREGAVRMARPDLEIAMLRGSVNTRLAKLDAGDFDAIILACAGLDRLGLAERIRERLAPEVSLPAVGQGAIGVECRLDNARINALLAPLHCPDTATCLAAERAMNRRLDGGCQVPIASFATLQGGEIHLRAQVSHPAGGPHFAAASRAPREQADQLGRSVAETLLADGADVVLRELGLQPGRHGPG
ncbi:MAG: hydroxymethylbilane synthase [Pseudomonadota bacterium]